MITTLTIMHSNAWSIIWVSLVAQLVKIQPTMQENMVWFLGQKIHWRRDCLPTPLFLGLPRGSAGKESTCNVGDLGLIPGFGRSSGDVNGYPLQYSGLENSMDCIVHGVAKSQTQLSVSLAIIIIIIISIFKK